MQHISKRTAKMRFYASKAWRVIRNKHLSEQPLCVMCESMGVITLASVVDHTLDFQDKHDTLATDHYNHTSLCKSHHDIVTATYDRTGQLKGLTIDEAKEIKYKALTHDADGFPL